MFKNKTSLIFASDSLWRIQLNISETVFEENRDIYFLHILAEHFYFRFSHLHIVCYNEILKLDPSLQTQRYIKWTINQQSSEFWITVIPENVICRYWWF